MNSFKNILLVSEMEIQSAAIERAVALAKSNQSKLTVAAVIPEDFENSDYLTKEHLNYLEDLIKPHKKQLNINLTLLTGRLFLEIIRLVQREKHDLVIKTAENPVFLKKIFGSSDMHLLRKCPCPLWLIKSDEKPIYKSIMAAIDFEPKKPTETEHTLNSEIIKFAAQLALSDGATLHLVHSWTAFAESIIKSRGSRTDSVIDSYIEEQSSLHRNSLNNYKEQITDMMAGINRIPVITHMPRGEAEKMIALKAKELRADVVVMGTVGRTGLSGLIMGNTAESILDQLSCSVLAVKPPGFETPVKI